MTEPAASTIQATFSPFCSATYSPAGAWTFTGGVVPLLVAEFDLSDEVVTVEGAGHPRVVLPVMSIFLSVMVPLSHVSAVAPSQA